MLSYTILKRACRSRFQSREAKARLRRARVARGLWFEWLENRNLLASDSTILESGV